MSGADFEDGRSELGEFHRDVDEEESVVDPNIGPSVGRSSERVPPMTGTSGFPTSGAAGGYPAAVSASADVHGVTRRGGDGKREIGRGAVSVDKRKFRYDKNRAVTLKALTFGASRADRLDAEIAGDLLNSIHTFVGIETASEDVLVAFDKALFWEHTINGASMMQGGEGTLKVGESQFEIGMIRNALGAQQRRFFRTYADDIADVNREVIAGYDPYEPESAEKFGQLMQVATERGLQRYPYLAHDSSDAGDRLSLEERTALMKSKRVVLESVVNKVDGARQRVSGAAAPLADNN